MKQRKSAVSARLFAFSSQIACSPGSPGRPAYNCSRSGCTRCSQVIIIFVVVFAVVVIRAALVVVVIVVVAVALVGLLVAWPV